MLASMDVLSGGAKTPYMAYSNSGVQPPNQGKSKNRLKEIIVDGLRVGYIDTELTNGSLCQFIVKKEEITPTEYHRNVPNNVNSKLKQPKKDSLDKLKETTRIKPFSKKGLG